MLIAGSFAGQSNGAAVTTGGLGTAAGWQWDAVSIGAGQALTYDTTVPFGVFPSMKCVSTSANVSYAMWQSAAPAAGRSLTSGQQMWFRLWLQQPSNPAVQHAVFACTASGTRVGDVVITTAGKLAVRDSAGTIQATSAAVVPSNAWFRIEGFITSNASTGQIELKYFSSPFATSPAETLTTAASLNTNGGAISQVRYGLTTAPPAGSFTFWIAGPAVSDGGYIGPGAVTLSMIPGAPASSGFTAVSKPVGGTSLRLKVATDAGLTQNVQYAAAQTPDSYGYVRHVVTGLAPGTQYYCQLADTPSGGTEALCGTAGQARTIPPAGAPASFRMAIASCIDSSTVDASPNTAIDDWVAWNADLNVFTGDLDYFDPSATDVPAQVAGYESMIAYYGIGSILTSGWGFYCRSDHDSTNVDNGDSDNAWTAANIQAAQEIFPWAPYGDVRSPTVGLYQSWAAGRVRFIMIDIRNTDRSPGANPDNASKTMLGATQLAWFYSQLILPEPLKVIITDTAWMGNFISGQPDKWWSYSTERSAILAFISANAALVQNVVLIHGDDHCVAVCPGGSNPWGGFPVYCAAPLRQTGSAIPNVAATFPSFYNNAGGDCRLYGRVTFTDDGHAITVNFQGWDAVNQVAQVAQTDTFTCPPAAPAKGGTFCAVLP